MVEFLYTDNYTTVPLEQVQPPASPSNSAKRRKTTLKRKRQASSSSAVIETNDVENAEAIASTEEDLTIHIKVYILGDKYDIPSLKKHVVKKFRERIIRHSSTPLLFESIILLYENTQEFDRDLKEVMLERVHEKRHLMALEDNFCDMLRNCPNFATDLIIYETQRQSIERVVFRCERKSCMAEGLFIPCKECGGLVGEPSCFLKVPATLADFEYYCTTNGCQMSFFLGEVECDVCQQPDKVQVVGFQIKVSEYAEL